MRHLKSYRKLGRTSPQRRALLRNLATSFLQEGRIKTTLPKAKELKPIVEKLITKGKAGTLHKRRQTESYLFSTDTCRKVFKDLGERYKERTGGYTRIIKLGERFGDGADMCFLELVDYADHEGKVKLEENKRKAAEKAKKLEEDKAKEQTQPV